MQRIFACFAGAALAVAAQPATAQQTPQCGDGVCRLRVTPAELLVAAERLVLLQRFDEARAMVAALRNAPGYDVQTQYLDGLIAFQTGDYAAAARRYRAILVDHPDQTGVRLALARTMIELGELQSADRQFRLAQQDSDLPPEIARTIRGVRDVIRARRPWRLELGFGIAPDTNINNATDADTVTVLFGGIPVPLELDEDARARSGLGQNATVSAGVRLPVTGEVAMLADVDADATNYSGDQFDDRFVQAAAGPELRLSSTASASLQAVGAQRWYGGSAIYRQAGVRANAQAALGGGQRLGVQLDVRHNHNFFDASYGGWQAALYGTWERPVAASLVASATLFARRDWLNADAYSNTEAGANLGFGGELPMGINFAVAAGASRAIYDAPAAFFSSEPRRDWRYTGRLTIGNRGVRLLGFSPELSVSHSRIDSSVPFFATQRTRFRVGVARYF